MWTTKPWVTKHIILTYIKMCRGKHIYIYGSWVTRAQRVMGHGPWGRYKYDGSRSAFPLLPPSSHRIICSAAFLCIDEKTKRRMQNCRMSTLLQVWKFLEFLIKKSFQKLETRYTSFPYFCVRMSDREAAVWQISKTKIFKNVKIRYFHFISIWKNEYCVWIVWPV